MTLALEAKYKRIKECVTQKNWITELVCLLFYFILLEPRYFFFVDGLSAIFKYGVIIVSLVLFIGYILIEWKKWSKITLLCILYHGYLCGLTLLKKGDFVVYNGSKDYISTKDNSNLLQKGFSYKIANSIINDKGEEEDLLKILHDNGVNYIRIRIWNDPYNEKGETYGGGSNDVEAGLKIANEAKKYGMKLLLCFHHFQQS